MCSHTGRLRKLNTNKEIAREKQKQPIHPDRSMHPYSSLSMQSRAGRNESFVPPYREIKRNKQKQRARKGANREGRKEREREREGKGGIESDRGS